MECGVAAKCCDVGRTMVTRARMCRPLAAVALMLLAAAAARANQLEDIPHNE